MPPLLQGGAKLKIIIDLAIANNVNVAGFISNRLATTGYVDDAESSHSDPYSPTHEESLAVWAAMHEPLGHDLNGVANVVDRQRWINEASNPAHALLLSSRLVREYNVSCARSCRSVGMLLLAY
jgi:hypothetical protein